MKTYQIDIKGIVQGVGFRPFIYQLATTLEIFGEVYNHSQGVSIVINGSLEKVHLFIEKIHKNKPPLSQIDSIVFQEIVYKEFTNFNIVKTQYDEKQITIMPPDISICDDCVSELTNPQDKRYQYPFITCTNCGPRYTIIKHLPYDRKNTSMEKFMMCEKCQEEYSNPLDRRYHAQPIGCPNCGPKLVLRDNNGNSFDEKIIDKSVKFLKDGKILAIKGVGGYHLVCDATNKDAVGLLRKRKNRLDKPFAVMVKNILKAKEIGEINSKEEAFLKSIERPIVLLKKSQQSSILSENVAPDIDKIGLFLPYTPIHYILLEKLDIPIVATSANLKDEPLCIDSDSIDKLSNVWDYCLDHDREIINGCDDSVLAVVNGKSLFFRRARGYAPKAIKLPFKLDKNILSVGANQKSTIAIGFEDNIILSPHIGDLNTIGSIEYFKQNIENLQRIYDFQPQVVVHDMHPHYESTKYVQNLETKSVDIQHHYAHILAVCLEKNIQEEVLGIAFDGTGLGDDGNLWGGEFLKCDMDNYERVAHIKYFKLLGGEKAIKEPRRVALSLLFEIYGKDAIDLEHPTIESFTKSELNSLFIAWEKNLNAPLSSSMGRLFDAVASLSDVIHVMSYEGQSGAMMESFYDKNIKDSYGFQINNDEIDIIPMIKEILHETDKSVIVSKFFNTIVSIIQTIHKNCNIPIVLGGGVFQNIVLLQLILDKIPQAIYSNDVPPNDGAISLGQIIKGK
jgi:hydrogenase maturation protein HypF